MKHSSQAELSSALVFLREEPFQLYFNICKSGSTIIENNSNFLIEIIILVFLLASEKQPKRYIVCIINYYI